MRFCLKSLAISMLCFFAHLACAGEDSRASPVNNSRQSKLESGQEAPAVIEADSLVGKKDSQIEATGKATLRKSGQSISADKLLYQQGSQDLDAQGNVVLEQDGNTMSGPHLMFNLDSHAGTMERPQYHFQENGARGTADVIRIQDSQHYELDNATYTTCPAGNDDWQMKMSSLQLDRDRQIGQAAHTTVEFKGVPILYSPWMDFPLNDQRKSGLLAPILGSTSKGGSELTLPVYWNIAANHDATIAPRFMLKRGVQLNNEFRYMGEAHAGEMHVDVLPNDAILKQNRARFALMHNQALGGGVNGYLNFNRVTDDAYFRDLGNAVNATSQVNLPQELGANYNSGWWTSTARVQRYQTLQDPLAPIAVPYARMPQLTFNARQSVSSANLAMAGEYVEFSHPTAVNGKRLVLNPSVSYPLVSDPAYYLTPKLALHSTHYAMGANNMAAVPDASRTLPLLSVDTGVAFERDTHMFGGDYLQTFEPRAFYVRVPYKDQNQLPNFDTAQADFSFIQMFTENRFFGSDRIGDANQITLAATTRVLDQSNSAERLKVTLGERFSFTNPQVNLAAPAASTGKSDILLAVAGRMTAAWSLDSEFQYDPNQVHTQRYNIAARYRPEPGKTVNFGYRFMRNTLRQVDLSTQWPLSAHWHAVGRWNFSFQENRILDAIGGLEYNVACWSLRLVAQHFTTATLQSNTGFFIQLELNDLVQVGSDPLTLLKRSVPGYTKLSDKPATQPEPMMR